MASFLDPYILLLAYLGIWALIVIIGYLLKAEKHGVLLKPYYFMLKTIVFNRWMGRVGGRFRRFWLTYFDIGAAMGIGLLVFAIVVFIMNIINLLIRSPAGGPTILIIPLPGLTIGWTVFPYILISIAVLLIPHEAAHGIASVLDDVPIKSSGVFMAVFLPGGFVEVDEEDLAKRKARTKLRVFAAGSFTNVATWLVVILLLTGMYQASPSGVLVTGLVEGGPAQAYNLPQWSVITAVNGTRVTSTTDLTLYMVGHATPGNHLSIQLKDGQTVSLVLGRDQMNASRAIIGINTSTYYPLRVAVLSNQYSYYIFNTFSWNLIILLGVGIVNMLPMYPFDGDRYFDTILGLLGLKNTKYARILASAISLSLLLGNLLLSFAIFGTVFPR